MGELLKVFMKHKSLGFRGCLLQSESLFWHLSYPVCDTAHLKGDNYNEKQNFNCDFYHYALCPMDDPATAYELTVDSGTAKLYWLDKGEEKMIADTSKNGTYSVTLDEGDNYLTLEGNDFCGSLQVVVE